MNKKVAELNTDIDILTNNADGLDYTIAVASVIITGIIDRFFVGELGLFENTSDEAKAQFREAKGQSNEIVNRFVEKSADRTEQNHPAERCNHSVGSVFRHGFHRRTGNAVFIQHIRVPSDDHGNGVSCPFRIAFFKRTLYLLPFLQQLTCRENLPAHDAVDNEIRNRMNQPCQKQNKRGNNGGNQRNENHGENSA